MLFRFLLFGFHFFGFDLRLTMNDQSQMQPILINQPQVMGQVQVQPQILNQSQLMSHSQAMNPKQMAQSQPMSSAQMMNPMNPPPFMVNRAYNKPWPLDSNINPNMKFASYAKPNNRNNNWKGKKIPTKDNRRMEKFEKPPLMMAAGAGGVVPGSTQAYVPPALNDLQYQNRLKARKFYNNNNNRRKFYNNGRFAPYAPRNTSSYIIRAKKSGGIASLVSPCPVTPAVLPTPVFSPTTEVLGDMAKEEWGVDGYGSMKGLIRLRSPGNNDSELVHEEEEEDEEGGHGGGSSDSDVEEHAEVERRLDHDLSRFEMIYPSYGGDYNNVLENRVDDQDSHIAQLEEENLTLKERLFLMERELGDLRRRMQFLERHTQVVEDVNEEVVENGSENESDGGGSDVRGTGDDGNEEMIEFVAANEGRTDDIGMKEEQNDDFSKNEHPKEVCSKEIVVEDRNLQDDEKSGQGSVYEMKVDMVRNENMEGGQHPGSKEEGTSENEFVKDEMVVEENKDKSTHEEARNLC